MNIGPNLMFELLVFLMLIYQLRFASTCTDDYIISGNRKIDLLPDFPFYIEQVNSSISIRRGEFVLIFTGMRLLAEKNMQIKRYDLDFIGDKYHFNLIYPTGEDITRWEQYSTGVGRRGFGGVCRD